MPEQVISLQLVLLELELLSPPAALEPLELRPPEVLEVLLVLPSLPQPLEAAEPPITLFSASASHSVSPSGLLDGPEGSSVAVEVGAADVAVPVAVEVALLVAEGFGSRPRSCRLST